MESWCDVWLYSLRVLLWNIFYFFHTDNFPFLGILVKLAAHWVGFLFPPLCLNYLYKWLGCRWKILLFILFTLTTAKTKVFSLMIFSIWSCTDHLSLPAVPAWPNLIYLPEHFRDFQTEKCYQSYRTFYRWETKSKYGYTLTEKSFLPPSHPSHEHCGSGVCSMPCNVPVILLRCSLNDFL